METIQIKKHQNILNHIGEFAESSSVIFLFCNKAKSEIIKHPESTGAKNKIKLIIVAIPIISFASGRYFKKSYIAISGWANICVPNPVAFCIIIK